MELPPKMSTNCLRQLISACIAPASLLLAVTTAAQSPQGNHPAGNGTARRELAAAHLPAPIRIDGVLDDEAWKGAARATGFTQSEPREGQAATEATEVMVAYDDQFLYIGALMHDVAAGKAVVNDIRKDFREDDQDDFEVIIDTFRDRRNGYVFIVNPAGGRVDRQISNEGREINSSWDGVWDVRTQRRADGWSAEFRIPFRTLRFTPGADQAWGVNFSRRIRRKNEVTFWAPVPRAYTFARVSLAGELVGLDAGRPRLWGVLERIHARPAYHKALERGGNPVFGLGAGHDELIPRPTASKR